jgi:hypothetical protein
MGGITNMDETTKEKMNNLMPIQHDKKRPRPKTGEVPNVNQLPPKKKRTENKW